MADPDAMWAHAQRWRRDAIARGAETGTGLLEAADILEGQAALIVEARAQAGAFPARVAGSDPK